MSRFSVRDCEGQSKNAASQAYFLEVLGHGFGLQEVQKQSKDTSKG